MLFYCSERCLYILLQLICLASSCVSHWFLTKRAPDGPTQPTVGPAPEGPQASPFAGANLRGSSTTPSSTARQEASHRSDPRCLTTAPSLRIVGARNWEVVHGMVHFVVIKRQPLEQQQQPATMNKQQTLLTLTKKIIPMGTFVGVDTTTGIN